MWSNFIAKSYNCEAALRLRRQHRALVDIATMDGHVRSGDDKEPNDHKRAKKKAPFDVYKKKLFDSMKAAGIKASVVSIEFWAECKSGWAEV